MAGEQNRLRTIWDQRNPIRNHNEVKHCCSGLRVSERQRLDRVWGANLLQRLLSSLYQRHQPAFVDVGCIEGAYTVSPFPPLPTPNTTNNLPRNRAGTVNLTSADPTAPPSIHFHYLSEGTGGNATASLDSLAVQEALTFARTINQNFVNATNSIATEVIPGSAVTSNSSLAEFVDTQGWGHHASCSCPIGADGDEMAVLDSAFRVRGTKGLRVVDASAFPRIPGFFITVPILMISEKAADVIFSAL